MSRLPRGAPARRQSIAAPNDENAPPEDWSVATGPRFPRQAESNRAVLQVLHDNATIISDAPAAKAKQINFASSESEYADNILKNDLRREAQIMPCRGFVTEQQHLSAQMRACLVDWIALVQESCKCNRRTFFLTISIIDRSLSYMQVDKHNLQLLGCVAFLIASKMEEIEPPKVAHLVWLCDGAYTTDQLLDMEPFVLQILGYCIDGPTVEHFLPHFIAASQLQKHLGPDPLLADEFASSCASDFDLCRNSIAWYLAELALLYAHMSHYPPSQVSASALYLANQVVRQVKPGDHVDFMNLWSSTLVQISGYTEPMLIRCVVDLNRLRTEASPYGLQHLQQINKRHADTRKATQHVSSVVP